ncbi:hypothetical protein CARUB_v10024546mg [Capsella rubella]|uniref:Prolamin-like domain-containing protein n=1 Tax=Capsella rubella TaxID=81985 RepID=R0HAJ9_9BRAS|nr:protein DOWN-REGULATED IN DIF1 11 [Capsella rubella]EOA26424.1 hypothetical protein CARUB_v10024546mg [Capsella rubella]
MEKKTIFIACFSIMVMLSCCYTSLAIAHDLEEMLLGVFDIVVKNWPSPGDYNRNVINQQSRKHLHYLVYCGVKMGYGGSECSDDYMDEVLRNKNASRDCCRNIVNGGKQCHIAWMNLYYQFYQFKRFSFRVNKTEEIWNKCYSQIKHVTPLSG